MGNYAVVEKLLVDVNIQNNDGDTALILAAREGHGIVVEKLLGAQGITVDKKNKHGSTALHPENILYFSFF